MSDIVVRCMTLARANNDEGSFSIASNFIRCYSEACPKETVCGNRLLF